MFSGWTCIKKVSSRMEGEIIAGILKSYEFSVNITSDDCGGVHSVMNQAMGAVKVWVRDEDLEQAIEVLKEQETDPSP